VNGIWSKLRMTNNDVDSEDLELHGLRALVSYLTDSSVLWVLIAGIIILVVGARFFAPW